jgi:periplasmic copper chaperone A
MRRAGTVLPAAALMATLTGLTGLTGCSAAARTGPELKISGAYVPQPALADMAAGYLTVTNTGDTAATLTSVTSDLAGDITMHTTKNDRMTEVSSFTVPAGGKLVLGLGGNHLMLMDLAHRPVVGDTVPLGLHFTKGFGKEKTLDVRAAVKPMSYRPKD